MIQLTAELEDVCFSAVWTEEGWKVSLFESDQAKQDFGRVGDKEITAELTLNNQEMAALLFLAANGDDEGDAADIASMYSVIEPKLANLPNELRPILQKENCILFRKQTMRG